LTPVVSHKTPLNKIKIKKISSLEKKEKSRELIEISLYLMTLFFLWRLDFKKIDDYFLFYFF